MSGPARLLAPLIAWLFALAAFAQEQTVTVEVRVTAVSGGEVYVDAGRHAGLEPGDLIEIQSAGATERAIVQAVSKSNARAELQGTGPVAVGDSGRVTIPAERLATTPPDAPQKETPTYDWEAASVPWDADRPLLAPPATRAPAARTSELSGRVFTFIDQTWDNERDQEFLLLRQGVDARLTNPFGRGGRFRLDAAVLRRETRLPGSTDTDDSGRIDRFSYTWGGTREEPVRGEVGRFLQYEFPQLGVLDGTEVSVRTDSGARYGASLGFFPDPRSDFRTGDDVQAAVYWRSPREGLHDVPGFEWGVAFQNTWHRGDEDRNLLVGDLEYRPLERLSLTAEAFVDRYGHGDVIKSSGLELTELDLGARYSFEAPAGIGAHFSNRRWPELLREEFANLTPEQIRDNRLRRAGLDAWGLIAKGVRLSGRVDDWKDQDSNGSGASVRLSARDRLWKDGEAAADLFTSEGAFSRTDGFRLSGDRRFSSSLAGVLFERSRSRQDDFTGAQSELVLHRVRLHWDTTLADWSISTYVETRFGDEQDSLVAGLFLQYRF